MRRRELEEAVVEPRVELQMLENLLDGDRTHSRRHAKRQVRFRVVVERHVCLFLFTVETNAQSGHAVPDNSARPVRTGSSDAQGPRDIIRKKSSSFERGRELYSFSDGENAQAALGFETLVASGCSIRK